MKTFKILTTVLASMLLFLFNTACNKIDDVEVVPLNDEVEYVVFESSVVTDAYMPSNKMTKYQLCGNSAKCNIAGASPSMQISGLISAEGETGEFTISKGMLTVCNESTGCTLAGHFEGKGVANESGFKFNSNVDVDSGIGKFKATNGKLSLVVRGEKIPGEIGKMQYSMLVYGNIEHPADNE